MMYFGITTRDVETYLGSGKHWIRHINTHGKDGVINLWYALFLDQDSLKEFATSQSVIMNIVESAEFANLKNELGIDGGTSFHTEETRTKMSKTRKGKLASDAHKEANSRSQKEKYRRMREAGIKILSPSRSKEVQDKIRLANTGKFYITDGINNRKIKNGSEVPENWRRGRTV